MRTYLFLLIVSGFVSYVMSRWLAGVARARGWACRKDDDNGASVPRLGGVSVYFAALFAIALLMMWDNQVADRVTLQLPQVLALAGATGIVFLLGLYDDLRGARPWQKIVAQACAGVALYSAGFRVELLTNPFSGAEIHLGWMGLPLTILWFVAISNAFNLIDGLDGLAAGVGLFSTLALFLLAMMTGRSFIAAIAAALAGALLGFLPNNFAPARIYLGDSGSLTIGLALAALGVESSQKGTVLVTISIPLVMFGLPLLDAGVATVRRFLAGHPIFHRDEEHLHHRLLKMGLTQRAAVLVLYGIAGVFALASLVLLNYRGTAAPLIALVCGVLAWVVVRQMQYPEFAELDSHVRQALAGQRAVLRNQILLRKAAGEAQQAKSLDEVWEVAGRVFEALEFDRARCQVTGAVPLRWGTYREEWDRYANAEDYWNLTIPLARDGNRIGTLELGRAMSRGPLLFRMSSLLDFVTLAFAQRVAQAAIDEAVHAFVEAD